MKRWTVGYMCLGRLAWELNPVSQATLRTIVKPEEERKEG